MRRAAAGRPKPVPSHLTGEAARALVQRTGAWKYGTRQSFLAGVKQLVAEPASEADGGGDERQSEKAQHLHCTWLQKKAGRDKREFQVPKANAQTGIPPSLARACGGST